MTLSWVQALLPHKTLTMRSQIWWLLFFALFPIAYLAGIWLETVQEAPAMMVGFVDRATSIRTAERFAASKGYPVNGWHNYVVSKTDKSLPVFYANSNDPQVKAISNVAPAQEVQVLFRSPDQTHEFRTYLSLLGQVTGYDFGKSRSAAERVSINLGTSITTTTTNQTHSDDDEGSMKNAIKLSDKEATAVALRSIADVPVLNQLVKTKTPSISTDEGDSARHDVAWSINPVRAPELTVQITIGVRDSEVVAKRITATLDKTHQVKTPAYHAVFITLYSIFLTFGAVYAMIRYAKRTLQKEVSHLRTLVIAALFLIFFSTHSYTLAFDQVATAIGGATLAKIGLTIYISALVSFSIMGLLVGVAYGSGEGEVREAYHGKLTSLDALLAGRIFSRDVGASFLFGSAAAAWLLLVHYSVAHFLKGDVVSTRSDVLSYTFSRLPWLTVLLGRQYDSLLIAVTGLLLPAAFILRTSVRKTKHFGWLIVFAALSVLNDASKNPTLGLALLSMLILVCALLLPFMAFDLLAAIVSLSALSFVEDLARLNAVFPTWNGLAVSLSAIAFLVLLTATYLALKGKPVNEADVSPLYAKNLAERMSLQAEVQAAREAQLRLLPQAAPDIPGVQFAACCLPARGLGGDFYDFFHLDANRIGIFVAQGGDEGLASALCIALAKGVLMHASLQPHSPTQILIDLETSLAELLAGGSGGKISFAYAVLDVRRNVLNYARMGNSPRFAVYRQDSGVTASAQVEHVVPLTGRSKQAATIYEGSAKTSIGDCLIFFTNGVASLRSKRFAKGDHQWIESLIPLLIQREDQLQSCLTAELAKHQPRASEDLTAVVLRITQVQRLAQEVVA